MAVEKSKFGVEIEVEGRDLVRELDKYWFVTRDGSLRGEAYEYVQVEPMTREATNKAIDYLRKTMIESDSVLTLSDRCGVHIHVNMRDMTNKQLCCFITAYLLLEDVLVLSNDPDRHHNLFCLRALDSAFLTNMLVQCFSSSNRFRQIRENSFKYAALNLYAIRKFGSLEFRFFKTPSDFRKIKNWVGLLDNIRSFSLRFDKPVDIVQFFSGNGPDAYMREALGDYVGEVTCPGADMIMWESCRNIQAIPYSFVEAPSNNEPAYFRVDMGRGARDRNMFLRRRREVPGLPVRFRFNRNRVGDPTFVAYWGDAAIPFYRQPVAEGHQRFLDLGALYFSIAEDGQVYPYMGRISVEDQWRPPEDEEALREHLNDQVINELRDDF